MGLMSNSPIDPYSPIAALVLAVTFAHLAISGADGHGFMIDPIARNSLWRVDGSAPRNYDDTELFCGGLGAVEQTGGKCGICGDPYYNRPPRAHETGGRMATNRTVKNYFPGSTMDILIQLDTNHGGYFTFDLCRRDSFEELETEECFERLKFADGSDRYNLPVTRPERSSIKGMSLVIPEDLRDCRACILRWDYHAGNNWGVCKHSEGMGCGPQELYRNCADISVGYMIRGSR